MVILDTSIIIDHLRLQSKSQTSYFRRIEQQHSKDGLAISMVSIQELFAGRSTLDKTKEQIVLGIISPLRILPFTYEIARRAGEITRDVPRTIAFADAAIAATAILSESPLFTLNTKDFVGIKDLVLPELD